jgi:hypothetical protein
MTDRQTCPLCSRKLSADRYVCRECERTARSNLYTIAAFAGWCDSKRARMGSAWSVGGGSRAAEQPVPFDPRVTKVIQPIHNDLTGWARIVWDEAPIGADEQSPGLDTSSVAKWLVTHCAWMSTTRHADTAFPSFESAKVNLENLFDRPPEKVYLGRCNADTEFGPCPESLYKDVDDASGTIACPRCGRDTDVADRREELGEGVENYLGTARELSRLLRLVLGEQATSAKTLWAYAKHGLIQSHGVRFEYDTLGRRREVPTYRVGDVREAARILDADEEQRKSFRKTMRGIVAS